MIRNRLVLVIWAIALLISVQGFGVSEVLAWGRGHFYVIGTGPAGPETATLQALNTIKKMDSLAAPEKHVRLFADYVGDKPVLFDPWKGLWDYEGKSYKDLEGEELEMFKEERFRLRDRRVERIKGLLSKGKDVGLLDYGNPCLFGPSHWYVEKFDPRDVVMIPGMGSDAAAMAALKKSTIPAHNARFVVQTAPSFLMGKDMEDLEALKDLGKHPGTMVFYMALWDTDKLFSALAEVLPGDMPCAVVYWAGYPERERILRGDLGEMAQKLQREKEKYMGLLLVGRFLEGEPYESAVRQRQESSDEYKPAPPKSDQDLHP